MKNSKFSFSILAVVVSAGIAITSCKKKDNSPAQDTDATAASDNTLAERNADDVTNMAGQASEDGAMSSYKYGNEDVCGLSCATVTRDTVLKKITVTFNGQQCLDGHTRSGTLIFDYSGSTNGAKFYRNPGYNVVVSSSGYVVDGNAITISKTITNTTPVGFNPSITNLTWSVTTNISITESTGTFTWKATKTKTLLNTSDTTCYHGQAVHITWSKARVGLIGNATGQTAAGENFTANVVSQVVRDFTCAPDANHPGHHPFIDGSLDFTPGTKKTRHIDYAYPNSQGNGACDNQALVTIGSYTKVITL